MASSTRLQLSVLGGFAASYDDEPLTVAQPGQRVLGYLAVAHRGRPVRRSALAERMWPDSAPERAASSLRSVLWRLPRPRGRKLVHCTAATVALHEEVEVDLWAAERLLGSAGAEVGGSAQLGELDTDLLPDWEEDWLVADREAFRQRRLHALERLADDLREQGRFTDALSAALRAVRAEPLRESAHRRVIAVHLAEGNHAEALREFEGYRRLLADALGLRPSPVIRQMVAPLLGRPLEAG